MASVPQPGSPNTPVVPASQQETDQAAQHVPGQLLEHLRMVTGREGLEYVSAPERLRGGYSPGVLLFAFELRSPPKEFAGQLVLRLKVGEERTLNGLRELALQEAAANLGCNVPRVVLSENSSNTALGGFFTIMERVEGRDTIGRFFHPLHLGTVVSLVMWNPWPWVIGYVVGSLWLGVALGRQQRRLHALDADEVVRSCQRHGLRPEDLDVGHVLETASVTLGEPRFAGYVPALEWLRAHQPPMRDPVLCHGDLHFNNMLGTAFKVTGLIDWESARIADREYDIAAVQCTLTLMFGDLSRLYQWPLYMVYRLHQPRRLDRERMHYYRALRAFAMAEAFVPQQVDELAPDAPPPPSDLTSRIKRAIIGPFVAAHLRLFRRLTGIALPTPKEIARASQSE